MKTQNSILLALAFVTLPAQAATQQQPQANPDTLITYDFDSKNIQVSGLYKTTGETKKSGLEAELAARENGKIMLENHLSKSCQGTEESAEALSQNWQKGLRSQGSAIYPNGVLRILLTIPLKDVFKRYASGKTSTLKTPEGETIVFTVPNLKASAVQCGTVKLTAEGKTVTVSPWNISSKPSSAKVVKLVLKDANTLAPANAEDSARVLKTELFSKAADGTEAETDLHFLPVVKASAP